MKKKVYVGMSGGVDSSVAAYLLLKQGYEVIGVYMKNWSGEGYGLEDNCPWEEDIQFVTAVCEKLQIKLKIYNFEREYREAVIEDFFEQYRLGNTPNPDILCNKYIKFEAFLNKALDDGADMIATGHYSKTDLGRLFKAVDTTKDQTYFLSALNSIQLSSTIFPLGELTKKEVRQIAHESDLASADRPDSQGICFIGEVDIKQFLSMNLTVKQGDIVDIDTGHVVGEHDGVWFYTLGQRRGIGIGGTSQPYFVVGKDVKTNTLYVGMGRDHPTLWQKQIIVEEVHTISTSTDLTKIQDLEAMIRYRGKLSRTEISPLAENNGRYLLTFSDAQWAPAPGQSVVFYCSNECLGLAKIV